VNKTTLKIDGGRWVYVTSLGTPEEKEKEAEANAVEAQATKPKWSDEDVEFHMDPDDEAEGRVKKMDATGKRKKRREE
jgi:hypothetical protein